MASTAEQLERALRDRRALLDRSAEAYLALADHLDDEIAALEAARRLAREGADVDFELLLNNAERASSQG